MTFELQPDLEADYFVRPVRSSLDNRLYPDGVVYDRGFQGEVNQVWVGVMHDLSDTLAPVMGLNYQEDLKHPRQLPHFKALIERQSLPFRMGVGGLVVFNRLRMAVTPAEKLQAEAHTYYHRLLSPIAKAAFRELLDSGTELAEQSDSGRVELTTDDWAKATLSRLDTKQFKRTTGESESVPRIIGSCVVGLIESARFENPMNLIGLGRRIVNVQAN